MVRIINYKQRDKEDGTSFFVLELQGGIEMVESKETRNFYATAKRTFLPSTFDEQTCSALIGTEMDGRILKEDCEPFTYVIKETGEEVTLSHRWVYATEEAVKPKQTPVKYEHGVTANSKGRWIVHLGTGRGKLVMLVGKLLLNLQTQLYYNVVQPDFGPECDGDYKCRYYYLQVFLKRKNKH